MEAECATELERIRQSSPAAYERIAACIESAPDSKIVPCWMEVMMTDAKLNGEPLASSADPTVRRVTEERLEVYRGMPARPRKTFEGEALNSKRERTRFRIDLAEGFVGQGSNGRYWVDTPRDERVLIVEGPYLDVSWMSRERMVKGDDLLPRIEASGFDQPKESADTFLGKATTHFGVAIEVGRRVGEEWFVCSAFLPEEELTPHDREIQSEWLERLCSSLTLLPPPTAPRGSASG